MIIKVQCEHCQSEFEDEGMEKTVFCPACGKETFIRAKGSNYSNFKTPPNDDLSGLILAGYLTAILMPLVGFIIGFILLAKNRVGSGLGCIIVSVTCFFIALALLKLM